MLLAPNMEGFGSGTVETHTDAKPQMVIFERHKRIFGFTNNRCYINPTSCSTLDIFSSHLCFQFYCTHLLFIDCTILNTNIIASKQSNFGVSASVRHKLTQKCMEKQAV